MLVWYVFYGVLLLVPLWFIVYSLVRFRLHYRDGVQLSSHSKPRLHYTKRVCALLLSCACLFNGIDGLPAQQNSGEIAIRCTFFFTYCVAWLFSFALLRFEYVRGLAIAWRGHRAFWPLSLLTFMGCAAFQGFLNATYPSNETLMWPRVAVYCVSCVISLFLTICGLVKPNDFLLGNWKEPLIHSPNVSSASVSTDLPTIGIQMDNFKKKRLGEKSIVLYELIVAVKETTFVLWKSYQDFESLQSDLRLKYSGEFRSLRLPQLPEFLATDDIDYRLQLLKQYMDDINYPAFYCEEFLDFLRISGDLREALLKEHYNVTGESTVQIRTISYTSSVPLPEIMHVRRTAISKPSTTFFDVAIIDWRQSESQDSHVEYELCWKLSCEVGHHQREGALSRRFNDYYLLHKALKQEVAPARLPDFPSKSYLSRLIKGVDKEAIEHRKRALELYMRNVMNDPAYLSQRVLDFIELNGITPTEVFQAHRLCPCDLKLHLPMGWEGEISESDEHFIIYLLRFERAGRSWTVKRRFREFDTLHTQLSNRLGSPLLQEFLRTVSSRGETEASLHAEELPPLPKKALPLSTPAEIESRRKALESYMQNLLQVPFTMEAFAFRQFVEEPNL